MTETHFFLGANTSRGFQSLYDCFTDSMQDTLHIIKGYPGCGKSGFMKRIADTMSGVGCSAEYIHCSGDPDSLDGVYFPRLHMGYVDSTSPHVIEPRIPGASEDYIDLGKYVCRENLISNRREIASCISAYKAEYAEAYRLLSLSRSILSACATRPGDLR